MTTKEAVNHIAKEFQNDGNYFYAWQSNIAQAISSELIRSGYKFPDMHTISNNAAKRFLYNFIMDRNNDSEEK